MLIGSRTPLRLPIVLRRFLPNIVAKCATFSAQYRRKMCDVCMSLPDKARLVPTG